MRTREDNLLKVANEYECSLLDNGYNECYDLQELAETFKEVITDYKKMVKVCEEGGIDTGESDIHKYEYEFEEGDIDNKEEIIDKIKERIISLVEICDDIPKNIDRKYIKDLVDIINNCENYDE